MNNLDVWVSLLNFGLYPWSDFLNLLFVPFENLNLIISKCVSDIFVFPKILEALLLYLLISDVNLFIRWSLLVGLLTLLRLLLTFIWIYFVTAVKTLVSRLYVAWLDNLIEQIWELPLLFFKLVSVDLYILLHFFDILLLLILLLNLLGELLFNSILFVIQPC